VCFLFDMWRRFCWQNYFYSPKGQENGRCAKLGHSIFTKVKLRQQISSTAINITIVEIAEMIYLT